MVKINAKKFAWEVSLTSGFFYTICAVFVALLPSFSGQLLGWLMHIMNLEVLQIGMRVTFGSFIAGLGQVLLYMYIIAWLFAWLFNRSIKSK